MKVSLDLNYSDFDKKARVLIASIPKGTKRAVTDVGKQILKRSNMLVPKDTLTLYQTGYYEISGAWRSWAVTVGYADPAHDMENPKTGRKASTYVVAVHEDLSKEHPYGEAKFLEKAFIEWVSNYPRLSMRILAELGL